MSKERYPSKKQYPLWIVVLIILVGLCLTVIVALFLKQRHTNGIPSQNDTQISQEYVEAENTTSTKTESSVSEDERPDVVIVNKKRTSYEEWLAAAMVVAVSMEHPEFELKGIYLAGETELSEKQISSGAYVVFFADGIEQAVYSYPLDAERTEPGTVDLFTKDLGFSVFERVDPETIDTESCQWVTIEDVNELIEQSLLVSLYEH